MNEIVLFGQILLINVVLSGDNAIVIALASRNLPMDQRRKAIFLGTLGAIALRILMTVAAVFLLQIPYIQALGSFLLVYIAIKLLVGEEEAEEVRGAQNIVKAVRTIILADFVMSVDNVLAVAAVAKGDFFMLLLGIGISLPLIVWGSTIIMKLLHQLPFLIYIGSGLLGYAAGEMFLADLSVKQYLDPSELWHWTVPVAAGIAVVLVGIVGKWTSRHVIRIY